MDNSSAYDLPKNIQSKLMGNGGTPAVTLGTGAGSGSISIEGDNMSGVITITTGLSVGTNTPFFTITLADGVTFPSNMIVHLTSMGPNVLDIVNYLLLAATSANSNTFNIRGLSIPPATTYKLAYLITGYKK